MKSSDVEMLEMIERTVDNTNYVKNSKIPYKGIRKLLLIWISFYALAIFVLILYQIVGLRYNLFFEEWYFPVSRLLCLTLYPLSALVYYFGLLKLKMTLKEKDFLKFFGFIIVLLVFSKIIYPLSFYIEKEFLFTLYLSMSLDLLIVVVAMGILHFYFKEKFTKILFLITGIYYLIDVGVQLIFHVTENPPNFLISIMNYLSISKDFGMIVIISFVVVISHLYRKG